VRARVEGMHDRVCFLKAPISMQDGLMAAYLFSDNATYKSFIALPLVG